VQTKPNYRFAGQDRLRITIAPGDVAVRIQAIKDAFRELARPFVPVPAKAKRAG